MAAALSEDEFRCSICQDTFQNPVSIPCGHNFCHDCIKHYWDVAKKCECPLCKEHFRNRPALRVNLAFKDITEKFQRSMKDKKRPKPVPMKRLSRSTSLHFEVLCDICHGIKATAIQSCLVCQASYCENHLTPHASDPAMVKHRLTNPATFTTSHLCRSHNQVLDMFCKTDQAPICKKCSEKDHRHHDMIPLEKDGKKIKTQIKKTQAEFQQMYQARLKKIEEIELSMEMSKASKEREIQASVQVAAVVTDAIDRSQSLVIEELEEKCKAAEMRSGELLKELEQEVIELDGRQSELQQLDHITNSLHLLQSLTRLSALPMTKDVSKVENQSEIYIGNVRRSISKLVNICQELERELSAEEVSKINRYAEDITLDPVTAAGWLVLSPDLKKVSLSSQYRKPTVPDDPRRFDSCVSVLGKQRFISGRHYWVVQVGDKRDWDLGVARESINRKGAITVCPNMGYWAICRRKGSSLSACAGPSVTLHLHEIPHKIGIFLDYEGGLVSFYNTEAKTHIYTYSRCIFTEPLYPYLNPCLHDNGQNTAPLVICPVEGGLTADGAMS
ncbi:E3 ubiquitin-protein ligase TRIM21-like isoform 1-T6 [Pholidichthys leucotaenia]